LVSWLWYENHNLIKKMIKNYIKALDEMKTTQIKQFKSTLNTRLFTWSKWIVHIPQDLWIKQIKPKRIVGWVINHDVTSSNYNIKSSKIHDSITLIKHQGHSLGGGLTKNLDPTTIRLNFLLLLPQHNSWFVMELHNQTLGPPSPPRVNYEHLLKCNN
jgi:hypothetical protein